MLALHAHPISTSSKGKQAEHTFAAPYPAIAAASPPDSQTGSQASDEDEEQGYFSDVSTGSSASFTSNGRSSPKLGDFVFDGDEDFEDYFEIVHASINKSHSMFSSPAPSQVYDRQPKPQGKKEKKKKSSYRKGTSSFFLSGPAFPTLPILSGTLSAQNPSLRVAANSLSKSVQRLNSFSSRYSASSSSLVSEESEEDTERHFERALQFANWAQSPEGDEWEAPKGANKGLVQLVRLAQ